jgi:hypothetical protein
MPGTLAQYYSKDRSMVLAVLFNACLVVCLLSCCVPLKAKRMARQVFFFNFSEGQRLLPLLHSLLGFGSPERKVKGCKLPSTMVLLPAEVCSALTPGAKPCGGSEQGMAD